MRHGHREPTKQELFQNLNRETAINRGGLQQVLQLLSRGFWGRMKWLFLGR